MAKPKRPQRRPGATARHRPPAKQTGTRTANGTNQGPIQKPGTNATRDVAKAASSGASMGRASAPVPARATGAAASPALRQRVQARGNRPRYQKRTWWSRAMPIFLPVVGVLLIVGIIIAIAHSQSGSSGPAHRLPPASVLNAVEHPNAAIFAEVGAGTSTSSLFKSLPNKSGAGLPEQHGKPVLFYVGGEFCPFCAADRWALIMALSRFGSFSGIGSNTSSTSDIYPGTPTFTFVKASYTSPYLIFDAKEVLGATNSTPLQSLSSAESTVFNTYDVPPYDPTPSGIPFLDFGGWYMTSVTYDVGVLHVNQSDQNSQALTYAQIVSGLSQASNPIAQGIVGTANEYTAAICAMTNNSDKAVCSSGDILQLESQLPAK